MPADAPMRSFHVGIAAEAFAAGFFAQAGCDVLVQYGANQPEYDLVITQGAGLLRVSVKGSQRGAWGLVQGHKKGRTYHEAISHWQDLHKPSTIYCLVQFKGVSVGEAPRIYLAPVEEVAEYLRRSRGGIGATILRENHTFTKGAAAGVKDSIPKGWVFSLARVAEMFASFGTARA